MCSVAGSDAAYPHRSCDNATIIGDPGCSRQASTVSPNAQSAQTPEIKSLDRHKDFLARITQGEVGLLFMGDSITDFWPSRGQYSWLKLAPYNPADFGISADKTEHVLWRIENGELDGIRPKVMVLMIGTNNDGVDQPNGSLPPSRRSWQSHTTNCLRQKCSYSASSPVASTVIKRLR